MTGSSGQLIEEVVRDVACGDCSWEGVVDVWIDREIAESGWECADCKAIHTDDEDAFTSASAPDRIERDWL